MYVTVALVSRYMLHEILKLALNTIILSRFQRLFRAQIRFFVTERKEHFLFQSRIFG